MPEILSLFRIVTVNRDWPQEKSGKESGGIGRRLPSGWRGSATIRPFGQTAVCVAKWLDAANDWRIYPCDRLMTHSANWPAFSGFGWILPKSEEPIIPHQIRPPRVDSRSLA